MAENEFGLKELYSVKLKATYPIEIGDARINEGETICYFDSIQLSGFAEAKTYITAHGGYGDVPHVWWETTKEVNFFMERGIFSKVQFAMMSNSKLYSIQPNEKIIVPARECVESDEDGNFNTSEIPCSILYVYDVGTGEKVNYSKIENKKYNISEAYKELVLDYDYEYQNGGSLISVGQRLFKGYLRLEGRTKIKDDVTGHTHTGIIIIPKLKLMSDLSIRLGENATPVVGRFQAKAIPDGERHDQKVLEMYFLNDDIDSDIQ